MAGKSGSAKLLAREIGERLKLVMEGETQASLSEKIGISQGNIAKYLQGKIIPRSDVLLQLLRHKNVNPTWMLTGQGEPYLDKQKYKITNFSISKASQKKSSLPYKATKDLQIIQGRLAQIAHSNPELLKSVKSFLQVVDKLEASATK